MRNLLCVLSLFVIVSCESAGNSESGDIAAVESPRAIALNYAPPNVSETKVSEKKVPERKLIRNGSMSFEVDDVSATREKITTLVAEFDGYIASEKRSSDDINPRHNQVIRIPGNQFEPFISRIEGLAKIVKDQDFTSNDVTEQFVDLEARLVAAKELEARYREIVKAAKTVQDILEVEAQIGITRSEIEQIEGKLKYLSSKVAFSTIELTYYQNIPVELPGQGSKFAEAFLGGWKGFVSFLIGITSIWPFIIVIVGVAWLIKRSVRSVRSVRDI